MLFKKKKEVKEETEVVNKVQSENENVVKITVGNTEEPTVKEDSYSELEEKIKELTNVSDFNDDEDEVIDKYAERIEALHKIKNDETTPKKIADKLHSQISDLEFAKIRALGNLNAKSRGKTRYKPEDVGKAKEELFKNGARFYPFKEKYNGKIQVILRRLTPNDLYAFIPNRFSQFFFEGTYREDISVKEVPDLALNFEVKDEAIAWLNGNIKPELIGSDYVNLDTYDVFLK